jgi:hypothetical protein
VQPDFLLLAVRLVFQLDDVGPKTRCRLPVTGDGGGKKTTQLFCAFVGNAHVLFEREYGRRTENICQHISHVAETSDGFSGAMLT